MGTDSGGAGLGGGGSASLGGGAGGSATGAASSGGLSGTGGAPPTGGMVASGGATTGGTSGSGGVAGPGGTPASGGFGAAFGVTGAIPGAGATAGVGLGTAGDGAGGAPPGGTAGFAGAAGNPGGWSKFVGNTTTGSASEVDASGLRFASYWDQITPENAGKWSSIQRDPDTSFQWGVVDAIYDYAQANELTFKESSFIWGLAQPGGIDTEDDIVNWIRSFCERYPRTALIDVVTEPPPHSTPYYVEVMGGGTNGDWQWITTAFTWARQHCPEAVLIINDYDNIEWSDTHAGFVDLVTTALANGAPIDAVGAQAHSLTHSAITPELVERRLEELHAATGLPVYITEMDIGSADDQRQLELYQQYFPMFYGKSYVPGITIWGWVNGQTWTESAGLVSDGRPRPAMSWLMEFLGRPTP